MLLYKLFEVWLCDSWLKAVGLRQDYKRIHAQNFTVIPEHNFEQDSLSTNDTI